MKLSAEAKARFRESLKQALTPAQLVNHAAHVGAALAAISPFLFGLDLPQRVQGPFIVGLFFVAKEAVELLRRWLAGKDLHGADSILDAAITVAACVVAGLFLGARTALVAGLLLLGAGLLFRRALRQEDLTKH